MREILFRGKMVDNGGEFVFGIPVEDVVLESVEKQAYIITKPGIQWVDGEYMTYDECIEVDPETVGQFTGLTDRNGAKIFEGDIIQWHNSPELSVGGQKAQICFGKYNDTDCAFDDVYSLGFYVKFPKGDCASICQLDELKDVFDIVGNIYDNLELLEGRK